MEIDRKFDVMAFECFNALRNQLFTSNSSLQNHFRERVVCSFDVVVDHISEKSASNTHRHVKFRKLLFTVLF